MFILCAPQSNSCSDDTRKNMQMSFPSLPRTLQTVRQLTRAFVAEVGPPGGDPCPGQQEPPPPYGWCGFYLGRCPGWDGELTSDEIDPRPAPDDGVPGVLVRRAALSARFALSRWSRATRWRSSAAFFSSSALLALSFSSSISLS